MTRERYKEMAGLTIVIPSEKDESELMLVEYRKKNLSKPRLIRH